MEDIEALFNEMGFETYFKVNIKCPLSLITHDKSVSHDLYFLEYMKHPVSAIVKMCDFYDNLNPFSLDKLGDEEFNRESRYFNHMMAIDHVYHFVDNCKKYRDEFNKS